MDLKNPIDLAQRKDILTFISIIILALLIGYNLIYKSQQNKLKSIKARIRTEHQINQSLQAVSLLQEKLQTYQKRSFTSIEVTKLANTISQLANRAGIKIESIDPQSAEHRDHYIELPIKIPLRCSYHQLGELLSLIESNQELILVKQLKMQGSTIGDAGESAILNIDLTVSGIHLK